MTPSDFIAAIAVGVATSFSIIALYVVGALLAGLREDALRQQHERTSQSAAEVSRGGEIVGGAHAQPNRTGMDGNHA